MLSLFRAIIRVLIPPPETNATIVCSLNLVTEGSGPYNRLHAVAQELREIQRRQAAARGGWRTALGLCVAFPEPPLGSASGRPSI